MDERLSKALEFANYRQTLNNQLHKVKIKTEGLLTISKNGGTFRVSQELICFLDYLIRKELTSVTLLDVNNLPINIDDVSGFLDEITVRYFEVLQDYRREYELIKRARTVKTLVSLEDSK